MAKNIAKLRLRWPRWCTQAPETYGEAGRRECSGPFSAGPIREAGLAKANRPAVPEAIPDRGTQVPRPTMISPSTYTRYHSVQPGGKAEELYRFRDGILDYVYSSH